MKNLFFACLAMLLLTQSYAQVNEFNLSDYKLPFLKRRQLEANFNLAGANNNNKTTTNQPGINDQKFSSNDFNGIIGLNYYSYLNNDFTQRYVSAGFGLGSGFNMDNQNDSLKSDSYNISPGLQYSITNRMYNKRNQFLETDLNLSGNYFKSNYSLESSNIKINENNNQNNQFEASLPIKIGIGRIEPVQDARLAVYLFDELNKQQRVKDGTKSEDVLALAKFISELKNKRFFDSRIQKIYEIEAIDSFMTANNYVIKSDARYFTTLNDFWDYGNGPYRTSGSRLSVGIIPQYYVLNNKNQVDYPLSSNTSKINIDKFSIKGGMDFIREKPVNLRWQNTIILSAYAGTLKGNVYKNDSITDYKVEIPFVQAGFNQKFGYYPNTRTEITYAYGLGFQQLFDKSDSTKNIRGCEGPVAVFSSDLAINYYFSPRLRLSFSSNLKYTYRDTKNQSNIGTIISDYNGLFIPEIGNSAPNKYTEIENKLNHVFELKLTYSIF